MITRGSRPSRTWRPPPNSSIEAPNRFRVALRGRRPARDINLWHWHGILSAFYVTRAVIQFCSPQLEGYLRCLAGVVRRICQLVEVSIHQRLRLCGRNAHVTLGMTALSVLSVTESGVVTGPRCCPAPTSSPFRGPTRRGRCSIRPPARWGRRGRRASPACSCQWGRRRRPGRRRTAATGWSAATHTARSGRGDSCATGGANWTNSARGFAPPTNRKVVPNVLSVPGDPAFLAS